MASCDYFTDNGEIIDVESILGDLLGPDQSGPLREAIRSGNEQMVRQTSLQLDGVAMWKAKMEAITEGRPDFLRILLEKDNTILEDLVATACQRKDKICIRTLIDFGWPINQPVYSTASLLYFAIDDEELMRWLTELGADINAKSNLDESVLSYAIAHGSIDVVHFLIAQGADLMHGNLLHCAAERKNQSEGAKLVAYLAQNGLDVNGYRYNNPVARRLRALSRLPTPLHVACNKQNIPVARVLLQYGADPGRMMLEAGRLKPPTVVERARADNNREMIDLFVGEIL